MRLGLRNIAVLALLALGPVLGGCQSGGFLQQAQQAVQIVSKSYTNPVTQNDLYAGETFLNAAIKELLAYKRLCAQGQVDTNCRSNVAAIQAYTRQIPPLLTQARGFVRNNDQVNAVVVWNQFVQLKDNLLAAAASLGVKIGG